MTTRSCPQCGASVPEKARFCGQCGRTVSEAPPPPAALPLPASAPPTTRPAPVLDGLATTGVEMMKTMADPDAQARARDMLNAAMVDQARADGAPGTSGREPSRNVGKTMLLGGVAGPAAGVPDASPLSKSVVVSGSPVEVLPPVGVGAGGSSTGPAPAPAPANGTPAPPMNAAAKTMLGMPSSGIPGLAGLVRGADAAAPAPPPQAHPPLAKTMLGIAMPGIAPTRSDAAAPAPAVAALGAAGAAPMPAPIAVPNQQRTILGMSAADVARQAPAVSSMSSTVALPVPPIVPMPAPLAEEPLPLPPRLPSKRGVPATVVVGIVIALVGVVGATVVVFMRPGAPLTAQAQLDESGHESLRIGCGECADGAVLRLGSSQATVKGGSAVLALPAPLAIGDNDLAIKLERAGKREEEVRVHVPVAYRVRADMTTLADKPPAITVRVEAAPGSEVRIEDKALTLDPNGRGTYTIPLASETEGPSDEQRTFDRKIAFTIKMKDGRNENGQLTAKASILPLHVDAPGPRLFTDKATLTVMGRTRPNAAITVDGRPGTCVADAQGRFSAPLALAESGEKTVEIVASSPPLAPRTVHARVVRVAALAAAAQTLEGESPLGYAAFAADAASKVGQNAFVDGEVVDIRVNAGVTVLLVNDTRACTPTAAPCLVRVVHGDEDKVGRGDGVRAYGVLAGTVSASGKSVPELDAALVVVRPRGAR